MKKTKITAVSVAANTTGFASNVTGAAWTLTANNSGDSLAHLLTIHNDSATDHSAKTALITGTAPNGEPQTETLALPAGTATSTSTKYWLTVTSVVPSATIGADTMDIGWAAASVSAWVYPSSTQAAFNMGFGCHITSGTPTYTVQHSYGVGETFNHSTVSSKTADAEGSYTNPIAAVRLSFAAAGGVTFVGLQVDS